MRCGTVLAPKSLPCFVKSKSSLVEEEEKNLWLETRIVEDLFFLEQSFATQNHLTKIHLKFDSWIALTMLLLVTHEAALENIVTARHSPWLGSHIIRYIRPPAWTRAHWLQKPRFFFSYFSGNFLALWRKKISQDFLLSFFRVLSPLQHQRCGESSVFTCAVGLWARKCALLNQPYCALIMKTSRVCSCLCVNFIELVTIDVTLLLSFLVDRSEKPCDSRGREKMVQQLLALDLWLLFPAQNAHNDTHTPAV